MCTCQPTYNGWPARPWSINSTPDCDLLLPIGTQEVWVQDVTYYRSRDAHMQESEDAGGADFYARVYDAE